MVVPSPDATTYGTERSCEHGPCNLGAYLHSAERIGDTDGPIRALVRAIHLHPRRQVNVEEFAIWLHANGATGSVAVNRMACKVLVRVENHNSATASF